MTPDNASCATPLEQPIATDSSRRKLSIGLPRSNNPSERRFPLTPEGVKRLIEKGFRVVMEHNAAEAIHYNDNTYSRQGTELADRHSALACDIVIALSIPSVADIRAMRRGAMLLTILNYEKLSRDIIEQLQQMAIVGLNIDLICDDRGNLPFADILAEIDGRAAIATASSMLADSINGKGILLGGVAGINPCEVTIIGSDIAAIAAARSAIGLGAIVRLFDDDAYALRAAVRDLGPGVIPSAMHQRVLTSALRTADVVIATNTSNPPKFDADIVDEMKKGVITFDLSKNHGQIFPSMPTVDLANAIESAQPRSKRTCIINAGSAVPRTAAMALSNTFNTMLNSIITCDGLTNALKLTPGLRQGVFSFLGKITDRNIARITGCRFTDINIFLQLS